MSMEHVEATEALPLDAAAAQVQSQFRPQAPPRIQIDTNNELYKEEEDEPVGSTAPPPPTDRTLLSPRKKQPRAIFIDWMRSIAVYAVVIVHIFVSIQRVTKVSEEMQYKIEGSFRTVLQFGMPMFFYFSGRSAAFAKRPFLPFFIDKLKRLLMPCLIGLCIIVIPTCYISRKYRPCAADIDDFFKFYGEYWTSMIGCNGLDWYWFLPVLLVLSVVDQVPMKWVKDRYPYTATIHWSWQRDGYAVVYVVVLTAALFTAGNLIGVPNDHIVLFILPYWLVLIVVPLMPLVRKYNAIYVVYTICPGPCLILAAVLSKNYPGDTIWSSQSSQILMVFFYNYYYLEGFIDTIFDDEWKQWRDSAAMHASLKPLALLGLIVGLAVSSPSTRENAGYIYLYPLYKQTPWICFFYVLGTWIWLIILIRYGETFYNEVLNKAEYAHITTSSMLVYLIHWLIIDIIQSTIIVPNDLTLVQGVLILIPLTFLGCFGIYFFLYNLPAIWKKTKACCGKGGNDHGSDVELVAARTAPTESQHGDHQ